LAVANYSDANGHYPPAYVMGPDGRPWHSWRILILPFIEQQALHDKYRFDEPWDGPNNRSLGELIPRTYQFAITHAEKKPLANYLADVGSETLWPGDQPFQRERARGEAVLFVENEGLNIHWMEPRDLLFSDMSFELQKPNGISSPYKTPAIAMADGSVRYLDSAISPATLREMFIAERGRNLTNTQGGWKPIEDGRDRELKEKR
jgi:hypothetical protein